MAGDCTAVAKNNSWLRKGHAFLTPKNDNKELRFSDPGRSCPYFVARVQEARRTEVVVGLQTRERLETEELHAWFP